MTSGLRAAAAPPAWRPSRPVRLSTSERSPTCPPRSSHPPPSTRSWCRPPRA